MTARLAPGLPPAIGRGDLLRLLARTGGRGQQRAGALAAALGFDPSEEEPTAGHDDEDIEHEPTPAPPPPAADTAAARRLQAPILGACVVDVDEGVTPPPEPPSPPRAPLTAADWLPEPGLGPPPWQAIVPRARLLPALARQLRVARPAGLNLDALVGCLARRQLPPRLPQRRRLQAAGGWILVIDARGGLANYRRDMVMLARWARQTLADGSFSLRDFDDPAQPLRGWRDLLAPERERGLKAQVQAALTCHPWQPPPAGTQVVVVSDLGLAGRSAAESSDSAPGTANLLADQWRDWLQLMSRGGAEVQVWSPVPLRTQTGDPALDRLRTVHWSAAGPLRPRPLARGLPHDTPARRALAQGLLHRLGFAPWIDPGLLRLLRLSMGAAATDAGLEHLAWTLGDLSDGHATRRMQIDRMEAHRVAFTALPADDRLVVQAIAHDYYRRFNPVLAHMHVLAWGTRVTEAEAALFSAARNRAIDFLHRLGEQPDQVGGVPRAEVQVFLHQYLDYADELEQRQLGALRAQLLQGLHRLRENPDADLTLPAGLPHSAVAGRMPTPAAPRRWRLVHDAQAGAIVLSAEPPRRGESPLLPEPLEFATLDVRHGGAPLRTWVELDGDRVVLAPAESPLPITLRIPGREVHIEPLERPRGVVAWSRDAQGLKIATPALPPSPADVLWRARPGRARAVVAPRGPSAELGYRSVSIPIKASSFELPLGVRLLTGIEPEFGAFLDLEVKFVTQRFRWIEPGEFWMGSPEGEADRVEREGPRHRVRLTRGFWLADTACTQALWLAVMGKNPSYFEGEKDDDECPVENVSWHDVQGFLRKLGALLPGCHLGLPTEAEREYACRAGTETPFSFGENITPEQVNYDGNRPYAGGKKGLYRQRTVPVKSLPPNDWGLHEMHGNVWEWCRDGLRTYKAADERDPVVDPVGPEGPGGPRDEVPRAVRGGSWGSSARRARSAVRYVFHPGYAHQVQGFRLSLRSIEPGQGPEGSQGVAGRDGPPSSSAAGGRRPATSLPARAKRTLGLPEAPAAPPPARKKPRR